MIRIINTNAIDREETVLTSLKWWAEGYNTPGESSERREAKRTNKDRGIIMPSNDSIKERKENEDNFFLAVRPVYPTKLQCCAGRAKTSGARKKNVQETSLLVRRVSIN